MKALFFDPYLDVLGGGELYTLSWLKFLSLKGYRIELAWKDKSILEKIEKRFGLGLKEVEINQVLYRLFKDKASIKQRYQLTHRFDRTFYLSDGSVPFLFGRKNLIHFQVPFTPHQIYGAGFTKRLPSHLINFFKLRFINKVICNSVFTKKFIDKTYGVNSTVVYPYVQADFKPGRKENIILSVGRFNKTLNEKKQEVLIRAFAKFYRELKDWRLVLAGSAEDQGRIKILKKRSKGLPVEILPNINFQDLVRLYSKAKIFWLATGFEENLYRNPERAEHFGISLIEAMASACVPVVYEGGGLKEVVEQGKNGFLFNNQQELIEFTLLLVNSEKERLAVAQEAKKRAQVFDKKHFYKRIEEII